jgi:hypothetical protein
MEPSEPAHVGDQIGEADDPDGAGRRDVGHRSDLDHDRGGQASIFVTVDHASSECLGIHAARRATRFDEYEPISRCMIKCIKKWYHRKDALPAVPGDGLLPGGSPVLFDGERAFAILLVQVPSGSPRRGQKPSSRQSIPLAAFRICSNVSIPRYSIFRTSRLVSMTRNCESIARASFPPISPTATRNG